MLIGGIPQQAMSPSAKQVSQVTSLPRFHSLVLSPLLQNLQPGLTPWPAQRRSARVRRNAIWLH